MQRCCALCFYALLSPLLIACGSGHSPQSSQNSPSEAGEPSSSASAASVLNNAYQALVTGGSDEAPALVQAVDAVVQQDPSDGRATLYSGFMRLWEMDQGNLGLA